jgi:hypothetical protein
MRDALRSLYNQTNYMGGYHDADSRRSQTATQAIRSIFVADYAADELSVRAHSAFCTEVLSRRLGTVHGPAARSVSWSVGQSDTARHHTHRNRLLTSFHTFRLYLGLLSDRLPRRFPATTQSVYNIRATCLAYPLLNHPRRHS